jgi:hypothetical protein
MLPTHDVHCPKCGSFVYTALSLEDVFLADNPASPRVLTDAQGDYLSCPQCRMRMPMKRIATDAGMAFRLADGASATPPDRR